MNETDGEDDVEDSVGPERGRYYYAIWDRNPVRATRLDSPTEKEAFTGKDEAQSQRGSFKSRSLLLLARG